MSPMTAQFATTRGRGGISRSIQCYKQYPTQKHSIFLFWGILYFTNMSCAAVHW